MTERPILFSGPMVRAILAGRKTVTRRVVTSRHPIALIGSSDERGDPSAWGYFFDGPDHHGYMVLGRGHDDCHDHGKVSIPCPYGAAGDRLWVRETFCLRDPEHHPERGYWYAATDDVDEPRWTPSIHMPRRASRITLEVVGVRVERLQEIDEADARAEGADPADAFQVFQAGTGRRSDMERTHRGAFACLWDGINGDRAPWASNPWVWRVEFRQVQP